MCIELWLPMRDDRPTNTVSTASVFQFSGVDITFDSPELVNMVYITSLSPKCGIHIICVSPEYGNRNRSFT